MPRGDRRNRDPWRRRVRGTRGRVPFLSIAVPVLLGVDNLVAGGALGSLGYPVLVTAPLALTTSAILCVAGYLAGSSGLARRLAGSSTRVGGAVLAISVAIATVNG